MRINDTTELFFELYNNELTYEHLDEKYYGSHELFEDYFTNHCKKTEERVNRAIQRYDIEKLKLAAKSLPEIIQEATNRAVTYFGFELNINFNLFVGAYGSNAYAYGYSIYLAIETLPTEPQHLKVLVAHEIAHAYHNFFLLEKETINMDNILMHGITGIYFEGVATYVSKKLVPDLPEHVYYSYDNSGEDWLSFCKENKNKLVNAFLEVKEWSMEDLREWFRLSGGKLFGHTRLGYYLGTLFVEDLVKDLGEYKTMTLLADESFLSIGKEWLRKRGI